ncbi:hypothetical protein [Bacteroides sp. AM10-21B]|uniref:hypothetical protein n=1 Tax=Bacteroides sp. AM10-21B TaxID=2292001 RepID=UPI000E50A8B1|nr:hypothetical protein [Bacteroides sp. AM10-21B]RHJ51297.1 hypothetical protein DW121_10115 [Bacteroides sp. AM10-21B]
MLLQKVKITFIEGKPGTLPRAAPSRPCIKDAYTYCQKPCSFMQKPTTLRALSRFPAAGCTVASCGLCGCQLRDEEIHGASQHFIQGTGAFHTRENSIYHEG